MIDNLLKKRVDKLFFKITEHNIRPYRYSLTFNFNLIRLLDIISEESTINTTIYVFG